MDSEESTPLLYHQPPQGCGMSTPPTPTPTPPPLKQRQLTPHSHGIVATAQTLALTPPLSQSQQKEHPNNDMQPANIIFQQENRSFSFSRKYPKMDGLAAAVVRATVESVADVVGSTVGSDADPSKKKRGRPRKASVDGNIAATGSTSSENPSKKVLGRTSSSGKKPQPEALVGPVSTMHTIYANIGEDILSMVMTLLQQGPPAVSVLSATGDVRNVTLQRSAIGSGTVMYEGEFSIISLSGSLIISEIIGNRGTIGGLSVILSGPDKKALGGVVTGMLIAASPVQVVVSRALRW